MLPTIIVPGGSHWDDFHLVRFVIRQPKAASVDFSGKASKAGSQNPRGPKMKMLYRQTYSYWFKEIF